MKSDRCQRKQVLSKLSISNYGMTVFVAKFSPPTPTLLFSSVSGKS